MPSGETNQITKAELIEQLEQMEIDGTIETITGDYINRYGEDEYILNDDDHFFTRQDLVDMIYCANRIFFIDIPEESQIKGFDLGLDTGGGIINDVIKLKSGKLIVITDQEVSIYRDEEHYTNGNALSTTFIYL